MNVEFLAPARVEFAEAVSSYETQRPGLGYEFAAEVQRTIERILQYPEAWSLLSRRTRRCPTKPVPLRHHLPSPRRHSAHHRGHAFASCTSLVEIQVAEEGALAVGTWAMTTGVMRQADHAQCLH
jgi:hypothetical protein